MKNDKFKISMVIPAFNEEGNIAPAVERLTPILNAYHDYEIIFVDDGSRDHTLDNIKKMAEFDSHIRYITFARNFGHQNALKAGLDHASGDCVITMDGDLQHPPELIPQLIDRWLDGFDVVYTIRRNDPNLSWLKRKTSGLFYKLMDRFSDVHIDQGAADFRLLDRSVVDVLKSMQEYFLFFRGLTAWVGFRQTGIEYMPDKRFSGETKYSLKRMLSFALTGITSFSIKPLRLSIFLGAFFAVLAFIYAIYAVIMKIFTNQTIQGWTSVLVSVLFIGGVQLIVLGIIAEYLGKLFMESKRRPHYIIREKHTGENLQNVNKPENTETSNQPN